MANFLWRATVIVHRYLGVAVGLLMLMWFASGIVMIYVPFPGVSQKQHFRVLPAIDWSSCCDLAAQPYDDNEPLRVAQLETVAGEPVLKVQLEGQAGRIASLAPGAPVINVDEPKLRAIAIGAASRIVGEGAQGIIVESIDHDQWTVSGEYDAHRPLFRFAFDDPRRTNIYISSSTAEVVLWTTGTQRFLNWFGAIPHWFYITALRSNGPLWLQLMIWTSILGAFLVVIGLFIGISQFKRGQGGRVSSYRGWLYWHHILGLVFGVLTLTWVISGTLSLNPWGLLESGGGEPGAFARFVGPAIPWRDVKASLETIRNDPPPATVNLTSAPLGGKLFWLAHDANGDAIRLDAQGRRAAVSETDLAAAAKRLAGATPIVSSGMITSEDAYYFGHHEEVALPAYRLILNDAQHTRYYLDAKTASLARVVDANGRAYRWLFNGFHSLDFTAWLRWRPVWDIIVLALLLGGLAGTITGTYLAVLRIKRDLTFKRPARTARQPAE